MTSGMPRFPALRWGQMLSTDKYSLPRSQEGDHPGNRNSAGVVAMVKVVLVSSVPDDLFRDRSASASRGARHISR